MAEIYWLASYPKSGNTWTRVFLANYLGGGSEPVDINALFKVLESDIASNRALFDEVLSLESSDMDRKSIERYRPFLYRELCSEREEPVFMKVHDAYTHTDNGVPLFPPEVTAKVVYILRNPLDVVVSFAHHNAGSIERHVDIVCDESYTMARSEKDLNNQLEQRLMSWSSHVKSWVDSGLPLHVMRYEDMSRDPHGAFRKMLEFLDITVEEERLELAVSFSSFERLREQEASRGFKEKNPRSKSFFRLGKSGSYKDVLSAEQIEKVIECHRDTMERFGYLP